MSLVAHHAAVPPSVFAFAHMVLPRQNIPPVGQDPSTSTTFKATTTTSPSTPTDSTSGPIPEVGEPVPITLRWSDCYGAHREESCTPPAPGAVGTWRCPDHSEVAFGQDCPDIKKKWSECFDVKSTVNHCDREKGGVTGLGADVFWECPNGQLVLIVDETEVCPESTWNISDDTGTESGTTPESPDSPPTSDPGTQTPAGGDGTDTRTGAGTETGSGSGSGTSDQGTGSQGQSGQGQTGAVQAGGDDRQQADGSPGRGPDTATSAPSSGTARGSGGSGGSGVGAPASSAPVRSGGAAASQRTGSTGQTAQTSNAALRSRRSVAGWTRGKAASAGVVLLSLALGAVLIE